MCNYLSYISAVFLLRVSVFAIRHRHTHIYIYRRIQNVNQLYIKILSHSLTKTPCHSLAQSLTNEDTPSFIS